MAWLGTYAKRREIIIDKDQIDNDLTHFPIATVLGNIVGQALLPLVNPSSVDDDFTGTNDDPPDSALWEVTLNDQRDPYINSNKLRFEIDNGSTAVQKVESLFYLTGDFDIQIDWDFDTRASSNGNIQRIRAVNLDGSDQILLGRRYITPTTPNDQYYVNTKIAGTWDSESTTATTDTSGKFQLIRVGSTLTANKWNGSSWDLINSRTCGTDDVRIWLEGQTDVAQNLIVDFDNFTVNSGTIVWPTMADYFTGTNGDIINSALWNSIVNTSAAGTGDIQSNKFRIEIPVSALDEYINVLSKFEISGDFDIQIDYDEVVANDPTSSTTTLARLLVHDPVALKYSYIQTIVAASNYFRTNVNGSDTSDTHIGTHYTTGKLRITRSGSVIKGYYWTGTQWEWNGSTAGFTFSEVFTGSVSIQLRTSADFDGASTTDYDNFTVNLGTVVWPELLGVRADLSDALDELKYLPEPNTVNDDFTGTNGDPPDTDLWDDISNAECPFIIASNQLNAAFTATGSENSSKLQSHFLLSGDFDIQIDIEISGMAANTSWGRMEVKSNSDSTAYAYLGLAYTGDQDRVWDRIQAPGSSCCNDGLALRSSDTGKIRFVRVGSNLTTYYDIGAGWVALTTSEPFCDHDVYVGFTMFRSVLTYTPSMLLDNFVVNSGLVIWPKIKDEFTGTDGDAPNTDLWEIIDGIPDIQSNKLNINISSTVNTEQIKSYFKIEGDFDIQIDYDLDSAPSTTSWAFTFRIHYYDGTNSNRFTVQRRYGGSHLYQSYETDSGVDSGHITAATSDTSGKLRIVRSGDSFTGYYWSGTTWVALGTDTVSGLSGQSVHVIAFGTCWTSTPTVDGNFDNFIVNSGTLIWPEGKHPYQKKIALTKSDEETEIFGEIETFTGASNPELNFNIGSNNFGLSGFALVSVPVDNDDYYTFDGIDDGLQYSTIYPFDPEIIDIEVRFRVHDKSAGVQCLWKTGGNNNGICIGIGASGYLGIFGSSGAAVTSIVTNSFNNNEWYVLKASKTNIILIRESDDAIIYETGTVVCGTGTGLMSIGFAEGSSVISGSTGADVDFFEGDIDYVKTYPESDNVRYICGQGYAVIHNSKHDLKIDNLIDTSLYLYYDHLQDDNVNYIGDTQEENTVTNITGDDFTNLISDPTLPTTADDDFTGDDGDELNPALWNLVGTQRTPYILGNKLRSWIDVSSTDVQRVVSKYQITGNFDIQADFDLISQPTAGVRQSGFYCHNLDETDAVILTRRYDSGEQYFYNQSVAGSWGSSTTTATTDASGKLRLVRTGTTLVSYYWNGSSWAQLDSRTFVADDLYITLTVQSNVTQSYTSDFDNFTVNSGTIDWYTLIDNFTGTDGDEPNTDLWSTLNEENGALPEIDTNKLTCVLLSGSPKSVSGVTSKFELSGDFDIQVDWDAIVSSTDGVGIYLRFTSNDGHYFYVLRQRIVSTHRYNTLAFDGTTWVEEGAVTTADNAGKFRLTRVGSTLRAYYWNGSGWTELGSGGFNYTTTANGTVNLQVDNATSFPALTCNFDNFLINSGTIDWLEKPKPDLWQEFNTFGSESGETKLENDELKLSTDLASSASQAIETLYKMSGDFDIQIDFDFIQAVITGGSAIQANFYCWKDLSSLDDRAYIQFDGVASNFVAQERIGATWGTAAIIAATNDYGSLRIIRSGTTLTFQYKDGTGSWTTLLTRTWLSDDCYFVIYAGFTVVNYGLFDNFVINSGTVKYIPGQRVWDDNYKAVYHMAQDPSNGADAILDSTINVNHGTPAGSMVAADLIDSLVGKGIDFDGVDDLISVAAAASINDLAFAAFSIESSILPRTTGEGTTGRICDKRNNVGSEGGWLFFMDDIASLGFQTVYNLPPSTVAAHQRGADDALVLNSISFAAVTYDDNGTRKGDISVDGAEIAYTTDTAAAVTLTTDAGGPLTIGNDNVVGGTRTFDGVIIAIRVSDIIRLAAWLKASSKASKDNLLTFAIEETYAPVGGTDLIDMVLDIKTYQDTTQNMRSDLIVATYATQDTKMSLQAYLQHVSDLKQDMILYQDAVQDMLQDAVIAGQIKVDLKTDLAAYFEGDPDLPLDLKVWEEHIEHLPSDLHVAVEIREDGQLDFSSAYLSLQDLKNLIVLSQSTIDSDAILHLILGDGIILKDTKLDINVNDGNKIEDVGLHLVVVATAPVYKAIYGLHLESAIKEIV